jgi:hypothetical protein
MENGELKIEMPANRSTINFKISVFHRHINN